jgi:uncharacterized protein
MMNIASENRRRVLELACVAATALVFLVIPKPPEAVLPMTAFIPLCIGFWAIYLVFVIRHHSLIAVQWGLLPRQHLGALGLRLGPLLLLCLSGGALYAVACERPLIPDYILVSIVLYPFWGLIQQWLVQALLVDNIRALSGASLPWLIGMGAVGFGAVHIQYPLLVVATGLMGAVYVYLFQRWRNLWPLALCHGWLGSFFYPWVLDENPTASMIRLILQ